MKIALIEGLWSYKTGYVRRIYAEPLRRMGHTVASLAHKDEVPTDVDVIIAHSFGAGYVHYVADHFENRVMLITMDAREWFIWRSKKYRRPIWAEWHHNFYQKGFLKGWKISNASNYNKDYAAKIHKSKGNRHIRLVSAVYNDVMGKISAFEQTEALRRKK